MKMLAELRNWATASFYRSALNVMGGLVGGFLVALVCRPVGTGVLAVGNINAGGTVGWLLTVTTITNNATTPNTQISFVIVENGNDQSFTVTLEGNVAKTLVIHALYTGTQVRIYVNGTMLLSENTVGDPFSASSLYFGIGNNANNVLDPVVGAGFIGYGYVADDGITNAQITANALEIIKRGDITDGGLGDVEFTYEYSASQANNGAPSVLTNVGTAAPNGDLTVLGTAVTFSAVPYFLGTAAMVQT